MKKHVYWLDLIYKHVESVEVGENKVNTVALLKRFEDSCGNLEKKLLSCYRLKLGKINAIKKKIQLNFGRSDIKELTTYLNLMKLNTIFGLACQTGCTSESWMKQVI